MPGLSLQDTDRFLPLRLGPTAAATLQEFIDIDVTADDLVRILRENRAYRELFARFVGKKVRYRPPGEEGAENPARTPTHRLIGLLGLLGSRNLILALRMEKAVHGKFPLEEDGSLDVKAGERLKCALAAEELFQRHRLEYPETAFAGGLLYDWIAQLLAREETLRRLDGFFKDTWKLALRTGLVAAELARRVPGQLPKQSLAGGLVLGAGQLLLANAAPDTYPEALKKIEANAKLDALARLVLERQQAGYGFEEVSAHALFYYSVFADYVPVVRHAREPFALKSGDPAHYAQAQILLLATELARDWRVPTSETDPVLQRWAPRAAAALRLSPATLLAVMQKVTAYT